MLAEALEKQYSRCDCLSDMLRWIWHVPATRKANLLAIAWSRHVWAWLGEGSCHLVEEFEASLDEPEGANYAIADDMIEPLRHDADHTPEHLVRLFEVLPALFGLQPTPDGYRWAADAIGIGRELGRIIHEIYGNPFRPVSFSAEWRTTDVLLLAQGIYAERAFDRMPILADALQDAGCDTDDLLSHLRDMNATHVRGCWALDLVLGKE
jgi:hypothetical protein